MTYVGDKMNIIEIIKRNIRKNSKIKLLNEFIDKNKMIELFSRIQDLIGIADIDQNIQYINKGEYKKYLIIKGMK